MPSGDQITSTYDYNKDQIRELNNTKEEQLDLIAAFKEGKIIIRRIESALKEYDKDTEGYNDLNKILEKAIHEYNELELAFMKAKHSENNVSLSERKSIMLELSDIINIDEQHKDITDEFRIWDTLGGIGEFFGNGASNKRVEKIVEESKQLRETDIVRQREEKAKEIVKNSSLFFQEAYGKKLDGNPIYQAAFKEELTKQKKEFDKKYYEYLDGNISLEDLENELNDIELLDDVDGFVSAIYEGASYYAKSQLTDNINELKTILNKMNIIYIAAKANQVSGTDTFENQKKEIAEKIVEIEEKNNPNLKRGEHPSISIITYDPQQIKGEILSGNHENIDKYQLFFYIQNEHRNFSNDSIKELLTEYPREFIKYISNQFLEEKGLMSALLLEKKEDKPNEDNKIFLQELTNIDKVLNLKNIDDLNKATDELGSTEFKKATDELDNNKILRQQLIETIAKDPDNLNEYLQKLSLHLMNDAFENISPESKKELFSENGEFLTDQEKDEKISEYKNVILDGMKNGLKGDDLMKYLIEKGYTLTITKTIAETVTMAQTKETIILKEISQEVKELDNISDEIVENLNNASIETIIKNEEFLDTTEKIDLLDDENFEIMRDKLSQGETFEEIDEYFAKNNDEYKELLERQSIKNEIINIDFEKSDSPIYQDYIIDNNGEGSFINSNVTGDKIQITENEAELAENNPKALKNIIDTNEKLDLLGLDFIWKYREKFIPIIKTTPGFEDIKMDINDDFINPTEFNNLLRYILTLLGEEPSNSYSGNISKIRNISQVSVLDDKKNSITKYGNIGTKFNEMGYIGVSNIDTDNRSKMQNYKQTLKDYKQKKET